MDRLWAPWRIEYVEAPHPLDEGCVFCDKLALGDDDRVRRVSAPVEDARNQALLAQAPRVARAAVLALAHLELDPLFGHGRPV